MAFSSFIFINGVSFLRLVLSDGTSQYDTCSLIIATDKLSSWILKTSSYGGDEEGVLLLYIYWFIWHLQLNTVEPGSINSEKVVFLGGYGLLLLWHMTSMFQLHLIKIRCFLYLFYFFWLHTTIKNIPFGSCRVSFH